MDMTREMHQQNMENTMKGWGARLDALKAKALKANAAAKAEMDAQAAEITKLQEEAHKHFEEFKASSKDVWKDVGKDLEARWAMMVTSVDNVWKKVRS